MTPLSPLASRTPSALPIVALVFSVLGFCVPPLLLVGIVIGVVALVQKKGSQAPAIVAVVLPALAIPVVGILTAIAIPNFIRFKARSIQAEAKSNLKTAYTAQKSFQVETSTFSLHPATVGFVPERGNRYAYLFAAQGPVEANTAEPSKDAVGIGIDTARFPNESNAKVRAAVPAELQSGLGIEGTCPECEITMVAAGNLDTDATIDVWSISSADRPGIPAGTPHNDVNDVTD